MTTQHEVGSCILWEIRRSQKIPSPFKNQTTLLFDVKSFYQKDFFFGVLSKRLSFGGSVPVKKTRDDLGERPGEVLSKQGEKT